MNLQKNKKDKITKKAKENIYLLSTVQENLNTSFLETTLIKNLQIIWKRKTLESMMQKTTRIYG